MDMFERARHLRDEYESALDEAETRRAAYHQAIRKLYLSGTPLREIAAELGMSHQRVHQIVGDEPPARKRRRRAAIGGIGALVVLLSVAGIVWTLHAHESPLAFNRVSCSLESDPNQIVARLSTLGVDPGAYAGATNIRKICFTDRDPVVEIMWVEPGFQAENGGRVRVRQISVPGL